MNALNSNKTPKPVLRDRLRKVIAGVTAHYGSTSSLVLNGVTYTPSQLVKLLQSLADQLDAVDELTLERHVAVESVKATSVTTKPVLVALAALAASQFGTGSTAYGDFGFTPRKVGKATVATKAVAAQKAVATRKTNGTLGKKQRHTKAKASAPSTSHPQG